MRVLSATSRRCRGVLAAAAVLALWAAAPAGAAPSIEWEPCGDDFPGSSARWRRAARLRQPREGRRPRSPSPGIPATDTANRIGSVFVNPGGPGGSGVGFVLDGFGEFLAASSTDGSTSSASTRAASAPPIRSTASTARTTSTRSSTATPLFPYQAGQYRPFYDAWARLGRRVPRRTRRIAEPHEHRRRGPRPRPAPPSRRRPQADVPRLLVRLVPRQHVRQPVPAQHPRARHRRRARPEPVVERLADPLRSRRHAGGVRRVPAPLRRGRAGVRVQRARGDGGSGGRRSRARSRASRWCSRTASSTPTTS